MCMIIYDARTHNDDVVDLGILERSFEANPDGLGVMWASGGKLRTWTSLDDFDHLVKLYHERRKKNMAIALHFRRITAGSSKPTLDACHPFLVNEKLGLMHNGTINGLKYQKDEMSDTQRFVELLSDLPSDFLSNWDWINLIDEAINGSRLLFMDNRGHVEIFNEKQGKWRDRPLTKKGKGYIIKADDLARGVWYSHTREDSFIIDGKVKTTTVGYHGSHSTYVPKKPAVPWYQSDAVGSKNDLERWSRDGYMVFVYGMLHAAASQESTLPSEVKPTRSQYVGRAVARGHELIEVSAEDETVISMRPSPDAEVKGYLLRAPYPLTDEKVSEWLMTIHTFLNDSFPHSRFTRVEGLQLTNRFNDDIRANVFVPVGGEVDGVLGYDSIEEWLGTASNDTKSSDGDDDDDGGVKDFAKLIGDLHEETDFWNRIDVYDSLLLTFDRTDCGNCQSQSTDLYVAYRTIDDALMSGDKSIIPDPVQFCYECYHEEVLADGAKILEVSS